MNVHSTLFELSEAHMHLDDLIRDLQEGKISDEDDSALQTTLEHILDHLCFSWSARDLSEEQLVNLPQGEFERHCCTVPNLFGTRTLE